MWTSWWKKKIRSWRARSCASPYSLQISRDRRFPTSSMTIHSWTFDVATGEASKLCSSSAKSFATVTKVIGSDGSSADVLREFIADVHTDLEIGRGTLDYESAYSALIISSLAAGDSFATAGPNSWQPSSNVLRTTSRRWSNSLLSPSSA